MSTVEGCPLTSLPPSFPSSQPDSRKEEGGQLSEVPLEHILHSPSNKKWEGRYEGEQERSAVDTSYYHTLHACRYSLFY